MGMHTWHLSLTVETNCIFFQDCAVAAQDSHLNTGKDAAALGGYTFACSEVISRLPIQSTAYLQLQILLAYK